MADDLTTTQIDAVTGDDIAYWLNNAFMPPDLIEAKVRYWVTKYAEHAKAEALREVDTRLRADGWDQFADEYVTRFPPVQEDTDAT